MLEMNLKIASSSSEIYCRALRERIVLINLWPYRGGRFVNDAELISARPQSLGALLIFFFFLRILN